MMNFLSSMLNNNMGCPFILINGAPNRNANNTQLTYVRAR